MTNSRNFQVNDFISIKYNYNYGMGSGSQGSVEITGIVKSIDLSKMTFELLATGKRKAESYYFSSISSITVLEKPKVPVENALAEITKIGEGRYVISFKGKEYEAAKIAYAGRLRVFNRVKGARGMKRGNIICNEYMFGIKNLRRDIEMGKKIA